MSHGSLLQRVAVPTRYTSREVLRYATSAQRQELLRLADRLRGRRIIHINATAVGGGVAEIMKSLVPYLAALGVRCDWYAINPRKAPAAFFAMTNRLHNALQGTPTQFTLRDWQRYRRVNQRLAGEISQLGADVLVLNDPQPLASIQFLPAGLPVIYISHIDTSHAFQPVWDRLLPFIQQCDQVIFSHRTFKHRSITKPGVRIFTPAIDPLARKQQRVPARRARRYLARYRVPRTGPLIVQVSRFDVWKNPLGVVAAHQLVRQAQPNIQTLLVGLKEAKDNPQADRIYADIVRTGAENQNLHIFFRPRGITDITEFTMMTQNAADVVIQNSIREGFGLTVTEAMWKGKPVIGGPAAGIRQQIKPARNGLVAKNSAELAEAILQLLSRPKLRRRFGLAAQRSVKKHFLMHRLVLDHLKVYAALIGK